MADFQDCQLLLPPNSLFLFAFFALFALFSD